MWHGRRVDQLDPNDLSYRGITVTRAYDLSSASVMLPVEVDKDSERPDLGRPALDAMREACELPNDLFGGNRAMRRRHEKWLPKEEEESETNHRVRVSRSTCFPFYRDTLLDLAARPFSRAITWEQDPAPLNLTKFLANVDGEGRDLTGWAKDVLLHAMHRGMDHVLVDASSASGETVASTDARRIYARRIDALSMLDIREEADETGAKHVVYCRFVTSRVMDTDTFAQKTEVVIIELEKPFGKEGTRVEWRFDAKSKKWFASTPAAYNPGNRGIPLFTLYTQQIGPFAAEPLLEDLAWVNLAHFQSRSDHAHVMRIARLITLVTLGFPDSSHNSPTDPLVTKNSSGRVVLGPLSRINSSKEAGKVSVSFLEPSGKSIELSFQDMEQLADEAKRLGSRHLTSKTGNVTARAISSDDAKSNTNLATFVGRLEVLLRQVIEAASEWNNITQVPEKIQPRLHKDFGAANNPEGGARALKEVAPVLSPRQLLIEAIRYGILRPDFPVEDNLRERKEEMASLDAAVAAAAGTPGGHDHPDPVDDELGDGAEDEPEGGGD